MSAHTHPHPHEAVDAEEQSRRLHPQLWDMAWLREQWDKGRGALQIARQVDCPLQAARLALRRLEESMSSSRPERSSRMLRPGSLLHRFPRLGDAHWMRQKYEDEKMGAPEIAALIGCPTHAVLPWLRRHGIAIRNVASAVRLRRARHFPQLHDADWLRGRATMGLTASAIARLLGCAPGSVLRAASRHGVVLPTSSTVPADSTNQGRKDLMHDADWLREQHVARGRSVVGIATELGVSPHSLRSSLLRMGIRKGRVYNVPPQDDETTPSRRTADGRRRLHQPGQPGATPAGWIYPHRRAVEAILGRPLLRAEQVYHVNGDLGDCRPDNLILLPSPYHLRVLRDNPPPWVPRCDCCGHPRPGLLAARPAWVPLVYDKQATYLAEPPPGLASVSTSLTLANGSSLLVGPVEPDQKLRGTIGRLREVADLVGFPDLQASLHGVAEELTQELARLRLVLHRVGQVAEQVTEQQADDNQPAAHEVGIILAAVRRALD